MDRFSIVGTTGSGKSTLARQVAQRLDIPCCELDALHWQPNWTPLPQSEMRAQVAEFVRRDRWVIEGGYSFVRPLIWERADTVIWLDYPLPVIFGRLVRRTARRCLRREALWNGNQESWRRTLSRDSILLWCLRSYRRRRRQFPELLVQPEYGHLHVLHFQSPRQADIWLDRLNSDAIGG